MRCRSASSRAGEPVNSPRGNRDRVRAQRRENRVRALLVQCVSREILQTQVPIGVDRGTVEPSCEIRRLPRIRAREIERGVDADLAQRAGDARIGGALEAALDPVDVDRRVVRAAEQHRVVAQALDRIREQCAVRECFEERRDLALDRFVAALVELQEHGDHTAFAQARLAELPELACVECGGAFHPWIERVRRDRVEFFAGRREHVAAVVDSELDLRVAHDAEVGLGESTGRQPAERAARSLPRRCAPPPGRGSQRPR